ncbi:Quercetin 2,3-dioxygenase [Kibdelosporangium sp. 4NS15]|uniref:Quercetin 2,3-dioxygenase n=1 Tax=Kibdelosporangium persicum TaxID=2698649 RepID=A0ABX2EV49_9PSEU|nr:pirin family protein [Kibdelosporangium persicum]NRN62832.1 Quercetin 2,3-dioxygenase [Kibdelosporangium persicum]
MSNVSSPEFFEAREVPLGGVRGVRVDRVLPQRALPTLGAWCFLDQFGPGVSEMVVLPHPHIGLQTVTWPLSGEIRHRDSVGSDVILRPGQLNLMTSGRGVSHSEVSVGTEPLHAVQLWVALPVEAAGQEPGFEHHSSLPWYRDEGIDALVFMGALGDAESRATTYTPLVGAQIDVTEGTVPLRPDFEYGLLVVDGAVRVADVDLKPGPLLYLGTGREEITLAGPARVILLGGEPFADDLVMWWNFVGRGHDEIAAARADWEGADPSRFGTVAGHGTDRIPAPVLPNLRLKPRKQPLRDQ